MLIGWTCSDLDLSFFVPILFLCLFIILSSASALATESHIEFVNVVSVDSDQRYHDLIDIRDLI